MVWFGDEGDNWVLQTQNRGSCLEGLWREGKRRERYTCEWGRYPGNLGKKEVERVFSLSSCLLFFCFFVFLCVPFASCFFLQEMKGQCDVVCGVVKKEGFGGR